MNELYNLALPGALKARLLSTLGHLSREMVIINLVLACIFAQHVDALAVFAHFMVRSIQFCLLAG